ncbi:hypothetical protein HGRIS_013104 [Hohenbuehelia grisea]|uniref:Nucleolus and neural progenitor protein-like N-terminal domain-containing protein n=1 Tax=Hohenbuehelia grisea TaxID=104357 RepID=A0ABR3IUF1_9AGAR
MTGPIPRFQKAPTLIYTARTELSPNLYGPTDAVLKELKIFSRKLQTAASDFAEELQILDRLFYKGKNQHRSALFWKRVCEVRRYGQRVCGLNVQNLLHELRCSFFGRDAFDNAKILKGSWNSIPNYEYTAFVLERLAACSRLTEQMQAALERAYSYFSLGMQSGAFIQLIVVLAALVSRMNTLISEIRDMSRSSWTALYCFLRVLDPKRSLKIPSLDGSLPTRRNRIDSTKPTLPLEPETRSDIAIHEDLGVPLARPQVSTPEEGPVISEAVEISLNVAPALQPPSVVARKVVKASNTAISKVKNSRDASKSKGARQKAKKEKPRDEIDDIFG